MVRQSREFETGFVSPPASPEAFRVEVKPERAAVRVCPIGEIHFGSVDTLRAQLEELDGFERIVVDLREATFLDSSGLRLLVEVYNASTADGFDLAIVPGPPAVQRAFEVSGLRSRLPFVDAPSQDGTGWE
jgi:anti-anti-sigma factor